MVSGLSTSPLLRSSMDAGEASDMVIELYCFLGAGVMARLPKAMMSIADLGIRISDSDHFRTHQGWP